MYLSLVFFFFKDKKNVDLVLTGTTHSQLRHCETPFHQQVGC